MSKHHRHDECCCKYKAMYGMGPAFGAAGYGAVGAGYGGYSGAAWGIKWIYALLILIVIVLQFGRKNDRSFGFKSADGCCDDGTLVTKTTGGLIGCDGLIDNSVLFIIVVFLLILCAGCWWGGQGSGYASGGFGGYGY